MDFVRFPSIPYLRAPDGVDVRQDKVLSDTDRQDFLSQSIVVEEKVDGENLGISFSRGVVRFQARGSFVEPGGARFRGLSSWIGPRLRRLEEAAGGERVLFGEWCASRHTVGYDSLPDWFLLFDVYDARRGYLSIDERNRIATEAGLATVPLLHVGIFSEDELLGRIVKSNFGREVMEGLMLRAAGAQFVRRAKMVRSGFTQSIDTHWMSGSITRNRLASR